MKHILLILAFFAAIWGIASGQSNGIDISPKVVNVDSSFSAKIPEGFLYIAKAEVTNNTTQKVSLRWERKIVTAPAAWVIAICDNNQCYDPIVSSNVMPNLGLNRPVELEPGKSTVLDVYLEPMEAVGQGTVEVKVSLSNQPDSVVGTATYNFNFDLLSSNNFTARPGAIQLYPNPAIEYFSLTNAGRVNQIVMYNMLGRQIRNFDVNPANRYDVSDLPGGIYMVTLLDRNGALIKTMRLSKRGYRS